MKKIVFLMLWVFWAGLFYASHSSANHNEPSLKLPTVQGASLQPAVKIDLDEASCRPFKSKRQQQEIQDALFDRDALMQADFDREFLRPLTPLEVRSPRIGCGKKLAPLIRPVQNKMQNAESPLCVLTTASTPISDLSQVQVQSNSPVPLSPTIKRGILPNLLATLTISGVAPLNPVRTLSDYPSYEKREPLTKEDKLQLRNQMHEQDFNNLKYGDSEFVIGLGNIKRANKLLEKRRQAYEQERERMEIAIIRKSFINMGPMPTEEFYKRLDAQLNAYHSLEDDSLSEN